jgi:hypothetical protein
MPTYLVFKKYIVCWLQHFQYLSRTDNL